ncbi:MAG: ZIP family metal transporter [Candidatus Gracilibacteria bacterium]|jgi:zinc transporter ZupT
MFPDLLPVIIATSLAAIAFLIGGFISHKIAHYLAKHASKVIAFGSGAMLAITFNHVLPEATELAGENAWLAVLSGVLFFFTLEHFLYIHSCPDGSNEHECENHALGPMAALGLGIHSFFDGVIIVFSFLANPVIGWLTTLGIFLHKLPAGAILHSLICYKRKKGNLWYILVVALATPLALVLIPFAEKLPQVYVGIGLAFSAGSLLYITLSDMLPETHRSKSKFNLVYLLLGIALIFGINTYFGEAHNHSEDLPHAENALPTLPSETQNE